ncbi:MAG: hypothetical protein OZ921_17940 [Sorangiineae bacterium]|nr:hypothetical protein [Polyangiaceae bacterium]MEB2324400.1 hypothetical protein [Sorangiineae bacterium]
MLAFEERWAVAVLREFAPAGGPGFSPRDGEVDYLAAFRRMMRASTRTAALGLRVALWIAALAPIWLLGKLRTFGGLARERRAELLARLLGHRSYVVRELTLVLKMSACMALFRGHAPRRGLPAHAPGEPAPGAAEGRAS